jgi:DNA-binding response OmpR family regulator
VRREPPDLLLGDVMMPDLDGFALAREVRGDPAIATTPFLMLSARAGEEARVEGLDSGADDYLVKPFTSRELVARVEGVFRLSRLRREAAESEQRRLAHALDLSEDRLSLALESGRMGSWNWNLN